MYCVGLKRHVEATVDEVKHLQTSKGSKYQIKGHFMEGGKKHNCTSMCSKAVYEQFSGKTMGAESKFDKLSNEIAEEYEEKGMSPEKAEKIGDATAAKIGMAKYGKKGMAKKAKAGMAAEDAPSGDDPMAADPTAEGGPDELFDESVVQDEQDGGVDFMNAEDSPSGDDPTAADPSSEGGPEELFDESVVQDEQDGGVDFMNAEDAPSGDDPMAADPSGEGGPEELFDESVVQDEQDGGVDFMNAEEPVVNDPSSFPAGSGHVIGSQTDTANYTPLHAEGVGPATEGEYEDFPRQNAVVGGYDFNAETFEAMAVYSSGPHDMQKGMAALIAGAPPTAKGNFVAFGPKYYTVKEGVSSNKFHLFAVLKLANGSYLPCNAYGRIGYNPRTWYGEVTSSESNAISAIQKKINKKAKKGYNLEFGAEGDSAPQESDPTTADPLADDPATSGGPSDTYGWTEEESEMGAFSAEFLANSNEMLCSECFEASCGGHVKDAEFSDNPGFTATPEDDFEDFPRQNDTVGGYNFNAEGEEADAPEASPEYDPLSDAPTDYDALTASDPNMDIMESQGIMSKKTTVGGLALVLGLVAAYRYSDQISDLFSKMGKSDE